jgi:hypothetical protein
MELTQRDLIKIRLLELSGLTDDNIDEKYKELYHKWLFFNSDEVYLDGKLLSESEKRLIAAAGFKSIDGELKFSSTRKCKGITLTENNFIKEHIKKYSLLINEIPYNETILNERTSMMLEYLENKLKLFTPNNPAPEEHDTNDFKAPKIKDKYCPDKIYKEFKKDFKCSKNTFDNWFINGKYDKKMNWLYKDGNKDQLRSFLFEVCGGWTPKETNTAFNIKVNSNNRVTKLNNEIETRLKRCLK